MTSGVSGGTISGWPVIAVPTTRSTWKEECGAPSQAVRWTRLPRKPSCNGDTLVTSNRKWSPMSESSTAVKAPTAAPGKRDRRS
jgi:hypothetical protein